MTIQTGDKLPDATFVKVTENGPEQVNTADYFKGRKVALFSVPGAFTPTCSAKHLPGFVDKADELKAKGVDEIVCTAVNDAFVMGAWSKSADAGNSVTMLADGNGDFAEAVGLTTVGQRPDEQAELATKMLLDELDGQVGSVQSAVAPHELIIRRTTAPPQP